MPVEFPSPEEASIVSMNADGILRELRVAEDGTASTVDRQLEAGSPTYYHSFVADRGRDTIGALWVQCEEERVENVLRAGVFTPGLELLQVVFEEPVSSGLYEPYAMTMILEFCGGRYIGSWADVSAQRTIQFTEEGELLADERGDETYPSTVYPGNNSACIPGAALLQVRPTLYMVLECVE